MKADGDLHKKCRMTQESNIGESVEFICSTCYCVNVFTTCKYSNKK